MERELIGPSWPVGTEPGGADNDPVDGRLPLVNGGRAIAQPKKQDRCSGPPLANLPCAAGIVGVVHLDELA